MKMKKRDYIQMSLLALLMIACILAIIGAKSNANKRIYRNFIFVTDQGEKVFVPVTFSSQEMKLFTMEGMRRSSQVLKVEKMDLEPKTVVWDK